LDFSAKVGIYNFKYPKSSFQTKCNEDLESPYSVTLLNMEIPAFPSERLAARLAGRTGAGAGMTAIEESAIFKVE
jgi:hypothetical protein